VKDSSYNSGRWLYELVLKLGVYFTDILRAAFAPIFLCQKRYKPQISSKKLYAKLSYEKVARKMLVIFTPYELWPLKVIKVINKIDNTFAVIFYCEFDRA
jgi:hypothetical protein